MSLRQKPSVPKNVTEVLAVKRFEVIVDWACDAMELMFYKKARVEDK